MIKCFTHIMPTDEEINDYFIKLSKKTGITLSTINVVGHKVFEGGPPQNPFNGG